MSATDFRPHLAAIKAAVKAALPASISVYDYSEVPGSNSNGGTLPTKYVAVAVERRYSPNLRISAQDGGSSWRTSVRSVASSVSDAGLLMAAVALALNEESLLVGGESTTSTQFESQEAPAYDSGRYSGHSIWTYDL